MSKISNRSIYVGFLLGLITCVAHASCPSDTYWNGKTCVSCPTKAPPGKHCGLQSCWNEELQVCEDMPIKNPEPKK